MLQQVLDHGLVDYVAMDVKGPLPDYRRYSGKRECAPTVKESIHILKSSRIPYEFRTTVVPNLHKTTDIARLAQSLEGGRVLYLQPFRAQHALAQSLRNSPEPTPAMLQEFCNVAERFIPVKIGS